MATPAPVSPKVRKSRIYRDITDTVQVLFAKVLEVSNQFQKDTDKAKAKKMGQAIVDRASGDTQANRRDMVFLLKEARVWIASEAAQVAKKAQALAEREALIAPAVEGWKAANQAWVKFVQAENSLGHDGLRAIWQGTRSVPGFWTKFAEMDAKVKTLAIRGNQDDVAALTAELAILIEEVSNFSIPNWCQHEGCGAPIEKTMTPKGGGKPFPISFCHEHVADKDVKPAGLKNGKRVLKLLAEPLSLEEIEANRVAARALNEANRLAKKNRRRQGAEDSAEASQVEFGKGKTDGGAKSIRKHEKELREQGGHPEGKKKSGKKKGATKGGEKEE